MARAIIESCHRLRIHKDLFRAGLVEFDSTTHGNWQGLRWTVSLNPTRSTLTIGPSADGLVADRTWELVPHVSQSIVSGVQWFVRGSDGKRSRYVLLTPDGRLGTRTELSGPGGIRYLSQRLWSADRQRARQRQKILRQLGHDYPLDWVDSHSEWTPKKPTRMRQTTYRRHLRGLEKHRSSCP